MVRKKGFDKRKRYEKVGFKWYWTSNGRVLYEAYEIGIGYTTDKLGVSAYCQFHGGKNVVEQWYRRILRRAEEIGIPKEDVLTHVIYNDKWDEEELNKLISDKEYLKQWLRSRALLR